MGHFCSRAITQDRLMLGTSNLAWKGTPNKRILKNHGCHGYAMKSLQNVKIRKNGNEEVGRAPKLTNLKKHYLGRYYESFFH